LGFAPGSRGGCQLDHGLRPLVRAELASDSRAALSLRATSSRRSRGYCFSINS
jgi:hypothetical protein